MGTSQEDVRSRYVGLRFTEKEYAVLKAQMASNDYLSISRYIRAKVLDQKLDIRRNVTLTDRNLRNQINYITAQVERIGVDYNQATKKFNSLAKLTRSDGSPVLNARAANYYLKKLYHLTTDLKNHVDRLIAMVDKLNYDNIPHIGQQSNN